MKRYTMIARRPRRLSSAKYTSYDDWRIPAEVGASGTALPTSLDAECECLKCGERVTLRRMTIHRRQCFGEERI